MNECRVPVHHNQARETRFGTVVAGLVAGLAACLASTAFSCAGTPVPAPMSAPELVAVTETKPVAQAAVSPLSAESMGLYRRPEAARMPPTVDELSVVSSGKLLVGQKPNARVTVNGRVFILDCIGTVAATFWRMNIDIQKDFSKYQGNGVNRLYKSLEALGALHTDRYPRPGDIIFWDNTWDANGDSNRSNDLRTHAGIVMAVDDDGTIYYLHESVVAGVIIEVMNLLEPASAHDTSGKRINNTIAIATISGGPRPERYFAGDVFGRFGDLLTHKQQFMDTLLSSTGHGTEAIDGTASGMAVATSDRQR